MIEILSSLSPFVLYPSLFIGLILLAGIILLPAIYFSLLGGMSIWGLLITTVLAGLVADSFWYLIGKKAEENKLPSLSFLKEKVEQSKKFTKLFTKYGVRTVFIAKFIYGTRLASHVLAGLHKVHYGLFALATSLGTSIWFFIFYALIVSLNKSIESTKVVAFKLQIIFLILVLVIVVINWVGRKYILPRLEK
jgi:membrane-associated protein